MFSNRTEMDARTQPPQSDYAAQQHQTRRPAEEVRHAAADEKRVGETTRVIASEKEQTVKSASERNQEHSRPQDSLELSFQLTREERDAMVKAFSREEPLTEEEESALKTTAERISKAIEETLTKRSEKRERVEKAVAEWYSKIAGGEGDQPLELVKLLRMAALGQFDFPLK